MKRYHFILLAIALVLGLSGCAIKSGGTAKPRLDQQVENQMGQKLVIPTYKKYPMLSAVVTHFPNTHPPLNTLTINYGEKKGKLVNPTAMNKQAKKNHQTVLYGIYQETPVITLHYGKEQFKLGKNQKIEIINKMKVKTLELKPNGHDNFFAVMSQKKMNYAFTFFLNKSFTKKDALNIIDRFTKSLQSPH